MKQKSVHIIYSGLGGHFDYVFNLVHAMQADQQTHILFFGVEPVPEYYQQKCTEHGISFSAVLKTGIGFKATWRILNELRKQRPGLVYVHSNSVAQPARLYKFLNRCKLVLIEHHNHQLKTAKDHKRSLFAQRKFDQIVFLTDAHLKEAMHLLKKDFREDKCRVIQTGIPSDNFKAPQQNRHHSLRIGMQSRLVPIKDHETLIRAFKDVLNQFPKAELRIAGDGVELNRLIKMASDLDISDRVYFEGMLPKRELTAWLDTLTVYVHATLGETSSIALMEALARSLPVIASDVSGIHDFLTPETAVLVPAKNVPLLEQAISDLLKDEKKRSILSENAFNFAVANCSLQKMAAAYRQLEKDILK